MTNYQIDFKTPTRFKNWDIVKHEEIYRYKPLDSGLAVKHHLMHHFLKSFYSYKNGVPSWEIRRTPTLNYWRKKFSMKPICCHEGEAVFSTVINGENADLTDSDVVTIYVIPYHLTTNVRYFLSLTQILSSVRIPHSNPKLNSNLKPYPNYSTLNF